MSSPHSCSFFIQVSNCYENKANDAENCSHWKLILSNGFMTYLSVIHSYHGLKNEVIYGIEFLNSSMHLSWAEIHKQVMESTWMK